MNEELWKELLRRLDQVGATAGSGWQLLVGKARADAIVDTVDVLVWIVFGYIAIRVCLWAKRKLEDGDDSPMPVFGAAFSGIAILVCAIGLVISVESAVYGLVCPEYAALNSILKSLSGKK